jgi:CO/xanthine dehydrogenase FAD-binding subunit
MIRGPASVVAAVADGRRAAEAIHLELAGRSPKGRKALLAEGRRRDGRVLGHAGRFDPLALGRTARAVVAEAPVERRAIDREDRPTMAMADFEVEARRCADCGCVAVNASDLATALVALDARIRTTRRTIAAEEFFDAVPRRTTVLEPGELVTEVVVPPLPRGSRQAFLKFRTRRSIDFPIASVAVLLRMKGGTVAEARIALGAVAPVPVRAAAAETFLRGKRLDADAAAKAAALALEGATPLAGNRFKLPVVRALVERALRG